MANPTCTIDGCDRKLSCRGLCNTHYERLRLHGTTDLLQRTPRARRADCSIEGCAVESQPSHGMCKRHYQADWYRRNRGRIAADAVAYRAANRGLISRRQRAQYRRDRKRRLADEAARYESDAAFRERKREATRQWREANPDRSRHNARVYQGRRRARMHNRSVGKVDLEAILTEHGMVCHICGDNIPTRRDLHFDHVIPLAKGGGHVAANIRPAHATCNLRKNARLIA